MNRPKFNVQDFDEMASWILDVHPDCSGYERKAVGRTVIYRIFDDKGTLGRFAITPGTRVSPETVRIRMHSQSTRVSIEGPWFTFLGACKPELAADERDRTFRDLCTSFIFFFLMMHHLDKAGRKTDLWEHLQQGDASDILPFHFELGGKFGAHRDLTANDVQAIVDRCRAFKKAGGKVPDFHNQLNIVSGDPRSFDLETLRGWLRHPRFAPKSPEN